MTQVHAKNIGYVKNRIAVKSRASTEEDALTWPNILYQIATITFIHISNRLAIKHKKSDWSLGSATFQKN